MNQYDIIFIHPPSIFDFRDRDDILFAFLSSSSIAVSPVYEMYPLGLKTIETYLTEQGKKVKIINLADMMLKNPGLDVEAFLKTLNAKIFGIDLHWLAHAQGSLAVAKMLKENHPDTPVILGGISASYFYGEIMEYPQVDFIIRGVDTPYLIDKLLNQLSSGEYHDIMNLCWKDKSKKIIINTFSNAVSYNNIIDWTRSVKGINYFMVFSGAGCEYNCTFCSGSKYSMHKHMGVNNGFAVKEIPAFLREIESIKEYSSKNSTVITLHHWFEDINLLKKVLDTFKISNIKTIHFTIFQLLSKDHIKLMSNYNIRPFFEISIQSGSEEIRQSCGNPPYSNKELEEWLDYLFAHNKNAVVGIFLMIGLPGQGETAVMKDVKYAGHLMKKYENSDLNVYMSPMRPFLDPGSIIYDNPEKFGYTIFFNTFKDYERALMAPHWKDSLNYETKWLSKSQLVDISYKATRELITVKQKTGKLPPVISNAMTDKIDSTVSLLNIIGKYDKDSLPHEVRKKILEYNNMIFKGAHSQQSPFNFSIHKYWHES